MAEKDNHPITTRMTEHASERRTTTEIAPAAEIEPKTTPAAEIEPKTTTAPERYELDDGPAYRFSMNRRRFMKVFGGGIAVVCATGGAAVLARSDGLLDAAAESAATDEIGAWLHIGEDGAVTVYTGKVEVGQNIRTSLAQAVAEELRVPIDSIEMVMGDTDLTPYDRGTFGSRTTPEMSPQLRKAAAAAREMLLDLAADEWETERAGLVLADGEVSDRSGARTLTFGELTRGQKLVQTIPADVPLTPAGAWKVAGTSASKVHGRAFVTGEHQYASDLALPDMLIGKVLRPPAYGATLRSLDTTAAEAMPGVVVVQDGEFVGVAAPDAPTAARAIEAIRAQWRTTPQPSHDELYDYLKANTSDEQGWGGRSADAEGDIDQGLAAAQTTLAERYTVAYIAHAPMEPRAALVEWKDGKLTAWTGTQRPFGVREELAETFSIPEDQVRVIMPDTGSAYGGKHTGEAAIEAARLASAARKPVKLVWTREEEFKWAYFRPAGVIEINSGIDAEGKITGWAFDNYNSGGSGIHTPYDVPNQRIAFHPAASPLRQGSYRALASTANHFARETHMDELAHAASMDPLAFRLTNLRDDRMHAVLEAAASAFGWDETEPESGHGFGIAAGTEKGGYVATCAEVAVDPGNGIVRVIRVVEAFECGAIINPNHLKSQVEGSVVQGLGGALFETIEFADGEISNPSFAQYRVPRFSDTPSIEVVLVNRKDLPSAGAGEAPIIGIAPAIGNAIFDATGVRLRSLPMAPNGIQT